jgi:hypothetical protein
MKRLFIDERPTEFFFNNETSHDEIFEWVEEAVMFPPGNIFKLNEKHSCVISKEVNCVCISGDEDYKEVTIETVVPII